MTEDFIEVWGECRIGSWRNLVEKVNAKMNEEKSIPKFLRSSDPLSDQAANYLLDFREEDALVDFKLTFNFGNEKDWLELTKDVMAFTKAQGGYIVFG